jgi:hypothetical protein
MLIVVGCCLWLYNTKKQMNTHNTVKVFLTSRPYSGDPLDYDAFVHHIAFRSVYSSLVTQYHKGQVIGLLAQSWSNKNNFKEWIFTIREGLTFEDGSPITAKAVVSSWTRAAYKMKKAKSSSGFFENLVGFDDIQSPASKIEGLIASGTTVHIKLKSSVENLLDLISFGLYAITSDRDYDPKTGDWLDQKKVTSSGQYKIILWNDNEILLQRREDFRLPIGHPKQFDKISLFWKPENRETADLIMGNSNNVELSKDFIFYGGANSSIAYARCRSWRQADSACSSRETRIALRDSFYKAMKKNGVPVTTSFFPLGIKDIKELEINSSSENFIGNPKVKSIKYSYTKNLNPVFQKFNQSIQDAITNLNLIPEKVIVPNDLFMKEYDQFLPVYSADIYMLGTGILIENPLHDVRFMFLSKEGIQLPDETGEILEELKLESPNLQKINSLLWNQAIIWPITHYASGFWAKKFIDFSLINTVLPPTDFIFLGR